MVGEQEDEDDDDEDNLNEHELAEEDSDIKIETIANSTGSPTKMRQYGNTHQGSSKPKNLIGRDSNGEFKNHQSFLKMRNLINQQEDGHQAMFQKINDKL